MGARIICHSAIRNDCSAILTMGKDAEHLEYRVIGAQLDFLDRNLPFYVRDCANTEKIAIVAMRIRPTR